MNSSDLPGASLGFPTLPGIDSIEAYLVAGEAQHGDIWPGAEKTIIWATPSRCSTPLAVVYLHGFSACRQETAPLCDRLASALGANVFYTRLRGHGRPAEHLAHCQPGHWYADALEALAVGQCIGERILLVGCSTGATLATWLALRPEAASLKAMVLISPNYGLRHPLAEALSTPLGVPLLRLVVGREYTFEPINAEHARYWTYRYPAVALRPMMQLVKAVRNAPLEQIQVPTLVFYNPGDRIIDPRRIAPTLARFGSVQQELRQINPTDPQQHVLAGDVLSPDTTGEVAQAILEFLGTKR